MTSPDHVAARTDAEAMLAAIVGEILDRDRVGMKDSFLALGGDSLLATLLAARIQDAFEVDLPPSAIFDAADIAALCREIQAAKQGAVVSGPALKRQERNGPVPLASEQGVLLYLHDLADDKSQYNIARVFRVDAALDPAILGDSFTRLLQRHETLRTRIVFGDGEVTQIIDPPGRFDLERIALGEEAAALRAAKEFIHRPFALDRGPLIRAALIRIAPTRHLLAISIHHLISDAGSLNVLLADLGALYAALAKGVPPRLPPVALHYADYALWQRPAYAQTEEGHVAYWKKALAGVTPTRIPGSPTDFQSRDFALGLLDIELPPGLSAAIRDLARRQDATSAMVLFAAFQLMLARLCGTDDVVGGMVFSRRTRPELQDVIGPLMIAQPVRTRFSAHDDFLSLLRRVKRAILDTYAHLEIDTVTLAERVMPPVWPMTAFNFVGGRTGPGALFAEGLRGGEPDAAVEEIEFKVEDAGKAPADLSMELYDYPDRIAGKLVYAKDVFDPDQVRRVADGFQALLADAAAAPERCIGGGA